MKNFLKSNNTIWRLARTIVQGILGVIIANIDLLINHFEISQDMKPVIVALTMCVLSPLMSLIGKSEKSVDQ